MFIKVILVSIVLIAIGIAGIAVKMFLKKGGRFTKSCSSVDARTGKRGGCTCNSEDGSECANDGKHGVDD